MLEIEQNGKPKAKFKSSSRNGKAIVEEVRGFSPGLNYGGDEMEHNEKISIVAEWFFYFENVITGKKWVEGPFCNKVVQGGLENLAALFIGEVPSETAAMHCVIGSSSIPAQLNDTVASIGEVTRKAITSKSRQGAMARLRTFFQSTEANGNHQCVGIVARSTDQAGSGVLLNRLVQPFSKAVNTVLTIEVRWTFQGVS